ncbi:hypothetical protein HNQ64_002785 [Prosthecobacter dejongeii]|uniref:Uncharacterized protein n=1 Tax=Prosthecobacter dejongeii TaxID=48465 RepID=A0A7W8DQN7_9BACT|nr:hypothetical protein [Prosthecobacter dejongeii]
MPPLPPGLVIASLLSVLPAQHDHFITDIRSVPVHPWSGATPSLFILPHFCPTETMLTWDSPGPLQKNEPMDLSNHVRP